MIHAFAWWSRVVDHLWKVNLQAALLAVLVGAVCLTGRRWLSPGWRSILWMLVFVRLVIPFGPSSTFSLGNVVSASFAARSAAAITIEITRPNQETGLARPETPMESGAQALAPNIEAAPARIDPKVVTAFSRWSARDACTALWLTVAAFLLGRLGWLRIQLSRQLSRLEVIRQPELIQLAESVASVARLNRVPRLLWGAPECSPAVCGWSFPVLILPRDSAILQPSQLRAVLLHEFRHIRTADTLLSWLPRVLCATFWFNPLLWWASRKWHDERELSCDEWVLRQIGLDQKRSYLETLVAIATGSSRSPALGLTARIVSSSTILERRIVAMKRLRPRTWPGLIAGPLLSLLAGATGLTDATQARNASVTEPDSAQVPIMTDLPRNDELVEAAGAGDLETVKRLIEGGADPNSVDKHGMGPLLNFHPEVTRYLLEHGAEPDLQNNENISPVIVGVCTDFECLRLMVEAGANVNRASAHNGETALHFVAGESDARGVRLLLDRGANPNARTKPGMLTFGLWRDARVRGETPLHRAAAWGSPEVIQLLLDAGADPTIRDANNDTPLSWASWYRRDKSIIDQLWYEGSGIGPDFPPDASSGK